MIAFMPELEIAPTLSGEVLKILSLIAQRTNVIVTGTPGFGKTYLVNDVVRSLRASAAGVSVCASTGVASILVGGSTVHSWAGFVNGDSDVVSKVDSVVKKMIPSAAQARMCSSSVLIIDEVGVLSAAFIFRLNHVLCLVRRFPDAPIGRLVVLAWGNFLQDSPPCGNIALMSGVWRNAFGNQAVVLDTLWWHIKERPLLSLLLLMRDEI